MLQILQSRILSVITWYHLAFFAVSIAMFGLTTGAIYVHKRFPSSCDSISLELSRLSRLFAIAVPVSLGIQCSLVLTYSRSFTMLVTWALLGLALALPYFFAGAIVSLALTRSPFSVSITYGFDLMGAAGGCLLVLALLNLTDGPSAVVWTACLGAAAAILFSESRGLARSPRPSVWSSNLFLLAVLIGFATLNGGTLHGLQPVLVKDAVDHRSSDIDYEQWNSFSRIRVYPPSVGEPTLWGRSPRWPGNFTISQRGMNIDGSASSSMYEFPGLPAAADFLRYDVTNLAHCLPGHVQTAVIGVGGGRDVLAAKAYGAANVSGVELNPIFVKLLTTHPVYSKYAGLQSLSGVELIADEGRSWFSRTSKKFDLIQMSLVDTWASTGAGAFTLSENGLYTVEAWCLFLSHLNPGGVFTVSRWYAPGDVNETGRMISLAAASLLQLGKTDPSRHVYVASMDRIATLVLSIDPITPEQLRLLDHTVEELGFTRLLSPDGSPSPVLTAISRSPTRLELERNTSSYVLDLTPPTDNRPFFFNMLPLGRLNASTVKAIRNKTGVGSGNLIAVLTLLVIFLVSLVLVICAVVFPLKSSIHKVGQRLVWSGTGYFFLIGVGFMLTEMGLLQRMSVFLGHPVYSLAVTLFSLILSTGLGSFLTSIMPLNRRVRLAVWSGLTAAVLLCLPLILSRILTNYADGIVPRALSCLAAIVPVGILLGFGFPSGMRLVNAIDARPTPWFWGINGAAGVLGGSLSIMISLANGINTTFIISAVCYGALAPLASIGLFAANPAPRSEFQTLAACAEE